MTTGHVFVVASGFGKPSFLSGHHSEDYVQRHAVVRDATMIGIVTLQCPRSALEIATPTHELLTNALQPGAGQGSS